MCPTCVRNNILSLCWLNNDIEVQTANLTAATEAEAEAAIRVFVPAIREARQNIASASPVDNSQQTHSCQQTPLVAPNSVEVPDTTATAASASAPPLAVQSASASGSAPGTAENSQPETPNSQLPKPQKGST